MVELKRIYKFENDKIGICSQFQLVIKKFNLFLYKLVF